MKYTVMCNVIIIIIIIIILIKIWHERRKAVI